MAQRQLSTADRGRVIAWLQDGAMQRNVAERLNVSQSVIDRLWIRLLDTGNVTNQRSGRPRSTTQREDRYFTKWTLHQYRVTTRQLRDHLRTTTGTLISDQTVRNRFRADNLWPRHPFFNVTEQPDETGAHAMSTGNVPSGHQFSSLMSLGSPYNLVTAGNGCTGVLESDLLTFTSISVSCLVVAVSWFGLPFRSMIRLSVTPLYVNDGNLNGNRHLAGGYPALCHTCTPTYWCGGHVSR